MKYFIIVMCLYSILATCYIKLQKKRITQLIIDREKEHKLYQLMTQWLYYRNNNASIADFLKSKSVKSVAIYGMNHSCECLCDELLNNGIKIAYVIEADLGKRYAGIINKRESDDLENVDMLIITRISGINEIKIRLQKKLKCPILSLQEILDEL